MRIIYLCAKHPPYDGRIHYKICPCLVEKGHEVINIHPNIDNSEDNGIKLVGFNQEGGLIGRLKSFKQIYKIGKSQNADIIIAPEPDSLFIAYLIKKLDKKTKVMFDCHEWYNVHFTHVSKLKNKNVAKLLNSFVSFIMKFIAKRIEAVITVNDTMTDYFKNYNINSHTIPSLMTQSFKPNMQCSRKDFIYFGQFGNGGQEKILLEAAKILKNECSSAKIVIIGGYHNSSSIENRLITEVIVKEKIENNIELKGWMNKDDAFTYLNTGLAGIMRFDTAYYNGLPALPNKIFEYMSVGMAIVCCKLNKEEYRIVNEEKCGLAIENESGRDLADAIIYLFNNMEECKIMGRNALNAVERKYNWNHYGNLLDNIIKSI